MSPAEFLASGLDEGEPTLVIATPDHQATLRRDLVRMGHDVDRVTFVDAEAVLETLIVNGEASWDAFQSTIGATVKALASGSRRVRVYAELIDLLWKKGNPSAATRVEGMWHELSKKSGITIARLRREDFVERKLELFAGILAHDLRNPLTAMLTATQLLMRRNPDDASIKPLRRILSSGERMTRMIDQLLDFTRIRAAAGVPIARRFGDVAEVARQVIDESEMIHTHRLIELQASGDTCGDWDLDRLGQALSNLVSNAVQHGKPDEPVRVTLDGTSPDVIRIVVHNAGAIDDRVLPHMFDPFRTTQDTREGAQGLGLGLFITREIATAHGGEIRVESSRAAGTTFAVELPRKSR